MLVIYIYVTLYINYYLIYILVFIVLNISIFIFTKHLFLVYLLLVTWMQTLYFTLLLHTSNISIQLITLELFSILSLFLIIVSRLLFKVYITWYFFSINNIVFIILLVILVSLYSQQIFITTDASLITVITNSYVIIDILNTLIFFKLYSILIALFFEQVYLQLEAFLLLYMLCIYIYFFFFIVTCITRKIIYIQFIKILLVQCTLCTILLIGAFNIISLFFLLSNINLSFVFILITNIKYVYIYLYVLYHTIYSFTMYFYFIITLFITSYSIYSNSLLDYSWFQFKIGVNFYSNYMYVYLLYLIVLIIAGLPSNTNFIIKLTFITATAGNVNHTYTVLMLSFIGTTYLFYSKLFLKLFNVNYSDFNIYSTLNNVSNPYIKFSILIFLSLNLDPFKIIEFYAYN